MNASDSASPRQPDLFGMPDGDITLPGWPEGLVYRAALLTVAEEAALLSEIARLPFAAALYKGYTARRRIVAYGGTYDAGDDRALRSIGPVPAWLHPLRRRAADWLGASPEDMSQALVSRYAPGTPLGWHRDAPDHEAIVGVSLAGDARMRFRRYPPDNPRKADLLSLALAPRSGYVMRGPARWAWQHSVAPTDMLRYSITFRTARTR